MKKITWLLLGLLIGQPVLVFLGQGLLVTTVPVHFGWTADMWNLKANLNLQIALFESVLAPALILASRPLPTTSFIEPTRQWILPPKTTWLWWLFGMNWFILLSLFSVAAWISWCWQIWTVGCGLQIVAYMVNVAWGRHRPAR
ncbi:hypothetical protein D1831_05210 [Lactiplantibacillus garii]|uniref:Uncharacterized protein n=1 Tax=Lactiplantibacillus garii TaxID=2306423 RepID=A0A3R8J7N6_9LACO|nr:hypothetical protein [Lactiplantibacillus garii]RRK10831.1 hypothetical protein D1831_05210 [Lactiplantibacillus garii]